MIYRWLICIIPYLVSFAVADEGAVLFQNVCAQCHGPKGEGKEGVRAPSIANLPQWYVTTQMTNFHDGKRGSDMKVDPQGALMACIAKALKPEQIQAVALYAEKLPLVIPTKRVIDGADIAAGQMLFYERCMECHRYNASGEMAFGSPPLLGRQGWYLADQLKKFKTGKRGTHKSDVNGAKMVQITNFFIEDDQMLRDVVAYILTLNPDPDASKETQEKQILEGSPFKDVTAASH